jgi:hypothetical protein
MLAMGMYSTLRGLSTELTPTLDIVTFTLLILIFSLLLVYGAKIKETPAVLGQRL